MPKKPDEDSLKGFVLNDMGTKDPALLTSIIKVWEKVHVKGSKLRVRVDIRKESYKQWITERVKLVKLPFIIKGSSQIAPHEPAPPLMSFEEANKV